MTSAVTRTRPLIVGAGPVGLGAALFLAREGVAVRLVDQAEQPSAHSKALAVNPRTLDLLEPTGVTEHMTEMGTPIHGALFWHRNATIAELSFSTLRHRYPWMLALSQSSTEHLLERTLAAHGVNVERGVALIGCDDRTDGASATLQHRSGEQETVCCPWLLAADGARSAVREQLRVDFEGTTFDRPWHLADVPLSTALPGDRAHVVFLEEGGFLFLLRVEHDRRAQSSGDPLWRVMSNRADPLSQLTQARVTGEPVWTSSFHISHRINAAMQVGHVYFAGDAAHIHSPIGARGMNLGLEDAFVFSRLALRGALPQYDRLRRPTDHLVVKRVERLTRLARGESWISRAMRRFALPVILRIPPIRRTMIGIVTGLDHDVAHIDRPSKG